MRKTTIFRRIFCDLKEKVAAPQIERGNHQAWILRAYGYDLLRQLFGIPTANIVWFTTEEEARNAGYRKAKNCP